VFMARQPSSLVVFEACEGAHYWAHEMEARGHDAPADRTAIRAPVREAAEK
jgi:hypothetical protein